MTEQLALFRAVCETPADDLPRLVYADWLEDHGRADRAAFIRVQCDLYRRPADDPNAGPLRRLEADMLRAGRAEWLEELPALLGVRWSSLWVRGFVDAALVNGVGCLARIQDELFAAAPITRLIVSPIRDADLDRVLRCPYLRRLEVLRLPGGGLTDQAAAALADCPALSRLRDLDLDRNRLTDGGVVLLLKALPGLRRLRVRDNLTHRWPQEVVDEALARRAADGPVG